MAIGDTYPWKSLFSWGISLFAILLCAAVPGRWVVENRLDANAKKHLVARGAHVSEAAGTGDIVGVSFSAETLLTDDFSALARMHKLENLSLSAVSYPSDRIRRLSNLKSLKMLGLSKGKCNSSDVTFIMHSFPNLLHLEISADLDSEAMAAIGTHQSLESLYIVNSDLQSEGVSARLPQSRIHQLSIVCEESDMKEVAFAAQFPNLDQFVIYGLNVTEESVNPIVAMPNLRKLLLVDAKCDSLPAMDSLTGGGLAVHSCSLSRECRDLALSRSCEFSGNEE